MTTTKPVRSSSIAEFLKITSAPKTTDISDPQWLLTLFNEELEKDQSFWESPRVHFRASNAGEECVRALTLDLIGHRVPFDANTLRIFKTGNLIEDVVIETAKKADVLVSSQITADFTKPPIRGRADMIIKSPDNKERFIVEIKSINERGFNRIPENESGVASASKVHKTHPRYIIQWNLYAWAESIDLPKGFLLFEAKNTQKQKIVWLERDKKLLEKTFDKLNKASEYAFKDPPTIAPIPVGFNPNRLTSKCKWCNRKYLCKKLSKDEVRYDAVREVDAKLR